MKFDKSKHKVLNLGMNNPEYQHRLGDDLLKSSSAENNPRVLVDDKLIMSWQCHCSQESQ